MTSPIEARIPIEKSFIGTMGLELDPPEEIGRVSARLAVVPAVCQPMDIVHGGVYASRVTIAVR